MSEEQLADKLIVDVACGGRRFWFNKRHPKTLYVDIRPKQKLSWGKKHYRELLIDPDVVMDFRKLDLPDEHFSLVVFDPPHLVSMPESSMLTKTYGSLDGATWRQDIAQGFSECFRVLKPNGVLIFKWATAHIPLKDILALTEHQPLFGHPTGRKHSDTHWLCFMKSPSNRQLKPSEGVEKVDRFEVIDETGRAYVKGSIYGTPVKVELDYQDDGRTLKVFVSPRSSEGVEG